MRRQCALGFVGLFTVLLLFGAGVSEQVELKDFNVVQQKKSLWCWAACGEMIMKYLDPAANATQCKQVRDRLGFPCCGNNSPEVCNTTGFPAFCSYGFTFEGRAGSPLNWGEIKQEISTHRRPFAYSFGEPDGSKHMVVVIGYGKKGSEQYVKIADPWGTSSFVNSIESVGSGKSVYWIAWSDYLNGPDGKQPHQIDDFGIHRGSCE